VQCQYEKEQVVALPFDCVGVGIDLGAVVDVVDHLGELDSSLYLDNEEKNAYFSRHVAQ
jgi:hypothetical protein